MKKHFITFVMFCFSFMAFAQSNNTVDITDEVYEVLSNIEMRGLCTKLSNVKPYTEKYIVSKLDEAIEALQDSDSKFSEKEINILQVYKEKYKEKEDGLKLSHLFYTASREASSFPVSFTVDLNSDSFVSGGVYSDSDCNSMGYEIWETLDIYGKLGNNISYRSTGYLEITKMPQTLLGTYDIGYWWYDFDTDDYSSTPVRTINTYRNYSVLPYSYKKHWDGSVYFLNGGVNAGGLTGWAFEDALAFGMQGEIHGTFFDNLLDVGIGRINREWAAMDNGSSLVFNANAHPMFGIEYSVNLFEWISFSSMTGFLEFPNQKYILENAWYITDGQGNLVDTKTDSFFFHNLFAIGMLDLDFKYLHWDFGSTVVMPNRFELGYSFPLLDRVVYQNNVGDYDNLALFTNLKLRYPGIGSVWGSFYLDEMNSLTAKIFEKTRCMFAYQAGSKVIIPFLPFTSLALRYTKVEPYCYTHQALSSSISQPYFPNYISESYTNNGESIGYYLPPNADELFVRIETKPLSRATFALQYQFIRHGVDWGSGASMYSGSSIYSELTTGELRDQLTKYFLRDGVYEWMNIISFTASYDFEGNNIPLQIYGTVGYVHNWFTSIGDAEPSKTTAYLKYESDEYQENRGLVLSVGVKAFY
ncbi:MAG: hypothetical protein K5829_03130 [Treponema sp.]|nr:hypothetical protein [Treponema sp.]